MRDSIFQHKLMMFHVSWRFVFQNVLNKSFLCLTQCTAHRRVPRNNIQHVHDTNTKSSSCRRHGTDGTNKFFSYQFFFERCWFRLLFVGGARESFLWFKVFIHNFHKIFKKKDSLPGSTKKQIKIELIKFIFCNKWKWDEELKIKFL